MTNNGWFVIGREKQLSACCFFLTNHKQSTAYVSQFFDRVFWDSCHFRN